MQYELVTEEDYENFPDDPVDKFLALEAICRRNLGKALADEADNEFNAAVRSEYMVIVASAAEALGINGVDYPSTTLTNGVFNGFRTQVAGLITKLRLTKPGGKKGTVQIAAKTRVELDAQIRRLRQIIETGDMPDAKRKALLRRLDELSEEIAKSRLNMGRTMAILAFVSMGVASGTSFLADAPDALTTITSLIGFDQEAENAELKRVGGPPSQKALPPPDRNARIGAPAFEPGGMDDDIPF